jgi:hypothetical protein
MAVSISAVSFIQRQANDPVNVLFTVGGPVEPDEVVQIFVSGRSDSGPGNFLTQVELTQTDHEYTSDGLSLPAGTPLFFHLCPRIVKDGQAEDEIDGEPFETFCVIASFTTRGISPPGPVPPPAVPTITGLTSRQFTLKERSSFFISWLSGKCDKYHLSWRLVKSVPGSTNTGNVQEIEAPSTFTFTARIFDSRPGEIYQAQVQACRHVDIGSDPCSAFSAVASLTIPENTRSLREFLQLSGASLPADARSIGMGLGTALGPSVRGLLHV